MARQLKNGTSGYSLLEILLATLLLSLLLSLSLNQARQSLARLAVESASRRVRLGLAMGRSSAKRSGRPCALQLSQRGWHAPQGGDLPPCPGVNLALTEGLGSNDVRLRHNLPKAVRFSSNGLVLDGGTMLVDSQGTELVRCVVMALPLGITRQGRYRDGSCQPDGR